MVVRFWSLMLKMLSFQARVKKLVTWRMNNYWLKEIPNINGHCRQMNGPQFALTILLAPPAIRRGWFITTGVQRSMRFPIFWNGIWQNIRFIYGPCLYFIAMVGVLPGLLRPVRASMCVCAELSHKLYLQPLKNRVWLIIVLHLLCTTCSSIAQLN